VSGTLAGEGQHDNRGRELLVGSRPPAGREWESAMSELYATYYPSLVRFALVLVRDLPTAEDVVQQSFLEFLRRNRSLEIPERENAYLRVIVKNMALRALTAKSRLSPVPDEALDRGTLASAEEEAVGNLGASDVASVLRELPPRQRETLALTMEGFQPSEIARILGIEPNTVRVSLYHARMKVLAHLALENLGASDVASVLRMLSIHQRKALALMTEASQPADSAAA
jgi:RNA polymerase sigma factor (sigma-70 family)